jgi:hypothetical protein
MTTPRRIVPRPSSRQLGRRQFLRGAAGLSVAGAALYAGCGGGDDSDPAASPTAARTPMGMMTPVVTGDIEPAILTIEHVANEENRFAIGVVDAENRFVADAAVHLRFFTIGEDGRTGTLRFERDMTPVQLDFDEAIPFYTSDAPFDVAGRWGVEMAITPPGGAAATIQTAINVLAASESPAIGSVPPASQNDTAADNPNTKSLCSRDPICGLHDLVIADVLGQGRPLVVQFSTPAFCETRFCGPVLDVLLDQVDAYRDRIDFIHIEVWQDFQLQQARPAIEEWNLPGEPYTFFIAADGRLVSRLEAVFTEEELTQHLDRLVSA